jgi:prolyl-tRNA synthetase
VAERYEGTYEFRDITPMSRDFDRWYVDVVVKGQLADYSGVRGCMVIRPYGYAVWENIQRAFDDMIKSSGHENWYFPLLIPEGLFKREAEHVEGFAPEVAWVTQAGGDRKQLEEPLVIRPTSETIIGPIVRRYIQSHRDLPLLVNQWCNVMRWELRTRLFLRTAEFLWQEGHTFHADWDDADREQRLILDYYAQLSEDWLAVPVVRGRKSESEKFAGAESTLSIEGMMRDGLALQMGTSHHFGTNFARAYDITYTSRDNVRAFCHSTSWGASTRLVGGVIMAHGDDSGLVMPPRVAPVQVVVVPIFRSDDERARVQDFVDQLVADLRGVRVRVDRRDDVRPGAKYAEWEMKGVPLRIEVGPRDVEAGQVTLADRLARQRRPLPATSLARSLPAELDSFQRRLYDRAVNFRSEHTAEVRTLEELVAFFAERSGFAWAPWCGAVECEQSVKEATGGVTTRNFPEREPPPDSPCVACGRPAEHRALLARAY